MANKTMKKNSKRKNIIVSVVCLIFGLILGFVGNIVFSLPASYKIPKTVSQVGVSSGTVDTNVISSNDLSIHFLELGNKYTGDCILIKFGDTEILVDGGSKASSIPTIESYVDKFVSDGNLEYIIVTHAHEDHYAGFATNSTTESLFDHYRPDGKNKQTIIDFGSQTNKTESGMYANYLRERSESIAAGAYYASAFECFNNRMTAQGYQAQRTYYLDDARTATLQILYQQYYIERADTENNYSVCFKIVYDSKTYLFTGDLEGEGEKSLVNTSANGLGEVELYKAGHHGSKTSSTDYLMSVIKPKIIAVCCVAGSSEYTSKNENQFPTQEFVDNVYKYSDPLVFVTSLCIDYAQGQYQSFNGTIVVCANLGQKTSVICSNNSVPLHESEWFKNNRKLPTKIA